MSHTTDNSDAIIPHVVPATTRRDWLTRAGSGFGALALSYLLERDCVRAAGVEEFDRTTSLNPLAPKPQHLSARAKSVIWLFMDGGPSHLDLFDPKPELDRLAGQPLPDSFGRPITSMGTAHNSLLAARKQFKPYGQSGIPVSDWYPNIAQHVDDLCIMRSCWADGLNHVGSVCQMNTGSILAGRPSLGAWVSYGLGSENENLPAYVVLLDAGEPPGGPRQWGTGFLPATYQGTQFRAGATPILHLEPPPQVDPNQQRAKLDFLAELNRKHAAQRSEDTELAARIAAYELAYRMQSAAPEAVDLSDETDETKEIYGLHDKRTEKFGRNCLLARRLVERGVRFVQLYAGSGSGWDAHTDIDGNHNKHCFATDQPIAGLLTDLKRRGLLSETLVIWGGEFGRTPMSEKNTGRDHNPYGFTIWLAGGGVKPGHVVGATDSLGLRAVEDRVHVHDIHATIMYLMGLDHTALTFLHNGRAERATVNEGKVVRQVLA
jgi:hypothetical protein